MIISNTANHKKDIRIFDGVIFAEIEKWILK